MTNYKLYYFNVTGLGEPIRYLLHYCGIKFEDIRFKDLDEWLQKYKKGTLFFVTLWVYYIDQFRGTYESVNNLMICRINFTQNFFKENL